MRLYSGKIKPLSEDLVRALVQNKDIEAEEPHEVIRDLEAVFQSYLQAEREVTDKAKLAMDQRGLSPSELGRVKRSLAEQRGIKTGEDMFDYLLDQCIEMLMHSNNVEEVFAEDHDLRRRMRPVLRKYLDLDEAVDAEVRSKLKHVTEGSQTWEVEYRRVMEEIQRRKGLV
jgi:hypothetical protein